MSLIIRRSPWARRYGNGKDTWALLRPATKKTELDARVELQAEAATRLHARRRAVLKRARMAQDAVEREALYHEADRLLQAAAAAAMKAADLRHDRDQERPAWIGSGRSPQPPQ